jgi:galactokinase
VSSAQPGRISFAPGRVNLLGEHTDYNDGLALPMAIGLGVEVTYRPSPNPDLVVESELGTAIIHPRAGAEAGLPDWARLAAELAKRLDAGGGRVRVRSDLPIGAGLSSSAAFGVALALALGAEPLPLDVARLCQGAEHAIGAPVGLMDQLASMAGLAGHALEIDFATLRIAPVAIPAHAQFVIVDSGTPRSVESSPYEQRRAECEAAATVIGPLGLAQVADLTLLDDPVERRRAAHVVAECERVRAFGEALASGDLAAAGTLMTASHHSLRDDFEVSTPVLDRLVEEAGSIDGVYGARLTGAGFGGCMIVLCRPGTTVVRDHRSWTVTPSPGAWVRDLAPTEDHLE